MQIYIHRNNQQFGPFTEEEIRAQLASGVTSLQDHVWWQGQPTWLPLGQTPLAPSAPPAIPGYVHNVPVPTAQRTSALAIASLVCSFVCCILSIPAIILGHLALSEIKRNPGTQGRGLAIAGLIIGYLGLLLLILKIASMIVLATLGPRVKEIFNQIQQQQAEQNSSNDTTNSGTPVTP